MVLPERRQARSSDSLSKHHNIRRLPKVSNKRVVQ
jgi:hypothetical protein